MKLPVTTQLTLYASQLSHSFKTFIKTLISQAEEPKEQNVKPSYEDFTPIRIPPLKGNGILILPEDFDYSTISLDNSIKIQSLHEENRVITLRDLHSPSVIQ